MTPDEITYLRKLADKVSPQDFYTHIYDRSAHSELPKKTQYNIAVLQAYCTPDNIISLIYQLEKSRGELALAIGALEKIGLEDEINSDFNRTEDENSYYIKTANDVLFKLASKESNANNK